MRNLTIILAAACTTAPFVAGCAASPATSQSAPADAVRASPQATGTMTNAGSVGYRERIALAPDSNVVVELRAHGNEPSWLVEIHRDQLTLTLQEAQARSAHGAPAKSRIDGGTRYVAGAVTVRAFDRLCADTMTGMPYPLTVEVVRAGNAPVLHGCGGEPATLLQQGEWQVRNIDGVDVMPGMQGTITFGADGNVSGRSFCNRYAGAYSLTGEGLTITNTASTMMACVGPAMELEGKFMAVLRKVARFEITPEGALVLLANDGNRVTAVRAAGN